MSLNKLDKKLSHIQINHLKNWLKEDNVIIKVSKKRNSKLGDFRVNKNNFQISVNYDLAPELFFLTLTHEIAHLKCYKAFKNKIKPHGKEWKNMFSYLIEDSINTYSADFQTILKSFKKNPKANYYSFAPMVIYFDKINGKEITYLKDIAENDSFFLRGKIFVKKRKRKIKYLCTEIATGRNYLIHALATVEKLNEK